MTDLSADSPPAEAPVLREQLDGLAVVVLTLNRPKALNALSDAVMQALVDELDAIAADDAVRCVVLQGRGRAFAAGADVSAMHADDAAETLPGHLDRWAQVRAFPKPIVAAVHGYVLGGGCELALSCDIVLAADDARFGLPEVSLGIIPGGGGTQLLPRTAGKSLAMEVVLAGRMLAAEEALAHGLCSRVLARDALYDEAVSVASAIALRPPLAVRLAKRAVADAYESSLADGIAGEQDAFATAFASADAAEGIAAFVEKREPRFEGR